jgi:site-specific DNA recombinase
MKQVRCAIYTRKSSDERLEQGFNSLDAQREACAAYILSQASEGWTALPDLYDDGGISGGTLERPALQRLLADVAAGKVDVIVVYKVDRLSRSLFDFAKLVEAFEKAGTSFVSITQSFNTTSSMGRLTLNMLLSFAQFEREVTAERIRDKIAASKAKGMWMGGTPPLGYLPNGRSLSIVDEHAAFVRTIFTRYLQLGTVRLLAEALERERLFAPPRTTGTGRPIGGRPLSRGQLYLMLKCRTYIGEVQHRERIYPGLHPAIIDRDLWDGVQAKLAENVQGQRKTRQASASLLAGKLVDEAGEALVATHTSRSGVQGGKVRYRYYVSRAAQHEAQQGWRIPAREIEGLVAERLAILFDDPLDLAASAWLRVPPDRHILFTERCRQRAAELRQRSRPVITSLVEQVRVGEGRVVIRCSPASIAGMLGLDVEPGAPEQIELSSDVRLTRSGNAMRVVHDSGAVPGAPPDQALIRLLVQARRWWTELREGKIDITALAAREQKTASYVTRVVRLAFLAPAVTEAILAGEQRSGVSIHVLTLGSPWPPAWQAQVKQMLPA